MYSCEFKWFMQFKRISGITTSMHSSEFKQNTKVVCPTFFQRSKYTKRFYHKMLAIFPVDYK